MRVIVLLIFWGLISGCGNREVANHKDLDENMLDLRIFHDNLGTYIRSQDLETSRWLLEGMDSTLQVIRKKFTSHRKLDDPFDVYYRKMMSGPVKDIRKALKEENFENATRAYRLLTKNCNNCHRDLEIRKEVEDWTSGERTHK
ncbi:MAG: hypothetical protein IAE96_11470 [Chitinophagaceae bacterium]|nr:hypothetical protein [Chitinophagaceae bacterium]